MAVITKRRLLEVYKEADLFRAKYRHADLTPHGWCFHGNKAQGWTGTIINHRLKINITSSKSGLSIDSSQFKYISFGIDFTNKVSTIMYEYLIEFKSTNNTSLITMISHQIKPGENIIYLDMTDEANWTGTIQKVELTIFKRTIGTDTWMQLGPTDPNPEILLEYFKADSVNVFKEINDEETITENDLNYLRNLADQYNKTPIDWDKPGAIDNRVQKFLTVVKSGQYDSLVSTLQRIEPYNGCRTCDTYTCVCNSSRYGFEACKTCDTCYGYVPCNKCNVGCFTEPVPCTCNGGCYQEAIVCTCDNRFYGTCTSCYTTTYTAPCRSRDDDDCSCDSYVRCSCDTTCYNDRPVCVCDTRCDSSGDGVCPVGIDDCGCDSSCYRDSGGCTAQDRTCYACDGYGDSCKCESACNIYGK